MDKLLWLALPFLGLVMVLAFLIETAPEDKERHQTAYVNCVAAAAYEAHDKHEFNAIVKGNCKK